MNDELELSDYEKGYLTAYYEHDYSIQSEHAERTEENLWYSVQVGDRMFDLCVWKDEGSQLNICKVTECHAGTEEGLWIEDLSKSWFLTEDD